MLVIATLPPIALWIGRNFMPESPRWLASMGSFGETLSVLQRIRSQAEASAEFEEVKAMAVEDYKSKMGSWKHLGIPWLRRIFIVGIGLAVIQQITGAPGSDRHLQHLFCVRCPGHGGDRVRREVCP